MLLNPFVAMLKNEKTGRFHPIFFEERPLPGPPNDERAPVRHKSKMHHTEGFDSRDDAVASIASVEAKLPGLKKALASDIPWDGEGIPAMVGFFVEDRGGWKLSGL